MIGVHVSVPCRGLTCFYADVYFTNEDDEMFPSPVGVLHVSIKERKPKGENKMFPSPVGVLHVSMVDYGLFEVWDRVSVPCRGLTCFYSDDFRTNREMRNFVMSKLKNAILNWQKQRIHFR